MKAKILILCFFTVFSFGLFCEEAPASKTVEASKEKGQELPYFPLDESADEASGSRFYEEFVQMLLTLGMLVGALILASIFMKKFLNTRVQTANESSRIKILEQRTLSNKTTLHLIEYEGKEYMLAESMQGSPLLIFSEEVKGQSPSPKKFSVD